MVPEKCIHLLPVVDSVRINVLKTSYQNFLSHKSSQFKILNKILQLFQRRRSRASGAITF